MNISVLFSCLLISPLELAANAIESIVLRIFPSYTLPDQIYSIFIFTIISILILVAMIRSFTTAALKKDERKEKISLRNYLSFLSPSSVLTFFYGLLIPSTVISSSAVEFETAYYGPILLVLSTFLTWSGIFLVFGSLIYLAASGKFRRLLPCLLWILFGCSVVNFLFFRLGTTMSPLLVFDDISETGTDFTEKLINLAVTISIGLIFLIIYIRFKTVCQSLCIVFSAAILSFSLMNCFHIFATVRTEAGRNGFEGYGTLNSSEDENDFIHLSKNGKNVVIFSMDRAISRFLPFCFTEESQLSKAYSDFIWYPNTISYGKYTIFATPSMFGGYDYTPYEFNRRSTESVVDKHNEAILALPVLFSSKGADVTVCDIPYANYHWIPDLSIYNEYGIRSFNTMEMQLYRTGKDWPQFAEANAKTQIRNFVMYSAFRCAPYIGRGYIYNRGRYLEPGSVTTPSMELLESYSVMEQLHSFTQLSDDESICLTIINNDLAHTPSLLDSKNGYRASILDETKEISNNTRTNIFGEMMTMNTMQLEHYHVTMSSLLRIGEWIDYLKEEGVYDNTRIIIVSDHGRSIFDDNILYNGTHIESMNSLLMVKDFTGDFAKDEFSSELGAEGCLKISNTFMTNADLPFLASKDIIEEAVNPFTGNAFKMNDGTALVNDSEFWEDQYYTLKQYDYHDSTWFLVRENIFESSNWKPVDLE